MSKNLIVYFSHDKENYVAGKIVKLDIGNTKVVAKKIQSIIGGDTFEILPLHEYPFEYHRCTEVAKKELENNERPKIYLILFLILKIMRIFLLVILTGGQQCQCVCGRF